MDLAEILAFLATCRQKPFLFECSSAISDSVVKQVVVEPPAGLDCFRHDVFLLAGRIEPESVHAIDDVGLRGHLRSGKEQQGSEAE